MAASQPITTYRDIPHFAGYRVGDDGSVWSLKSKGGNNRLAGQLRSEWRRLSVSANKRGYQLVNLHRDGKTYSRFVHRLVLETFIGPRPDGCEACHYPDHNKANNSLSNLRWDTHIENHKDNYRDRPQATTKVCRKCGNTHPVSNFYRDIRASDGLKTQCKQCHIIASMQSRDPEKKKLANRLWMRKHRTA